MSIYNKTYQNATPFKLELGCNSCLNTMCLIKRNLISLESCNSNISKSTINCKKGQQFIMEGAPVNGLYFILKGKAKVFRTGLNGKEQIVRFAKEGEIIGHRGFGTEEYYTIGAIALENATLCYFSKHMLQVILHKNPEFTYDLMLFYANELNKSESKVKSLSQMTVRERLADTLLYIHRKFGTVNGYLNLPLSRKEYADYAGTSEEQVIRILSAFKAENIIKLFGKKIALLDIHKLKSEIKDHNFFLDS